jgi:[ribosomal protein S5]-alanine N-acetyltransferase
MRFIRPDSRLLDAALESDEALARALGHDVVPGWATVTDALQPRRDALGAQPNASAWGPRFFLTGEPPELVG